MQQVKLSESRSASFRSAALSPASLSAVPNTLSLAEPTRLNARAVTLVFAVGIFVGAFLLFLVQPLIAKFILPWFGGSPAVWTTCMLFFQVLLVGGYAYAHLSIRWLTLRRQVILHLALLTVALLLLPITPGDQWKPLDGSQPTLRILLLLTVCLGVPYLALSATGPLLQAWFGAAREGKSPYRLYALSNVGSLLALVGYPFFVEPNLPRFVQARWWSLGLVFFAGCALACGMIVWKRVGADAKVVAARPQPTALAASPGMSRWIWFALPACACMILLAVTNTICQDIAAIPFLWVLPLSLYLLSFVISFDSPRWYSRRFWMSLLALVLLPLLWILLSKSVVLADHAVPQPIVWLLQKGEGSAFVKLGIYLVALFVSCMVCHGEVYRLRPATQKLSGYYLTISAGGAAGGFFVAIVAPRLFAGYFELQLGFLLLAILVSVVLWVDQHSPLKRGRHKWAWSLIGVGLIGLALGLYQSTNQEVRLATETSRNFYGVLKVVESDQNDPDKHKLRLKHGTTTHGLQFVAANKRLIPASYYSSSSGVGRLFESLPKQTSRRVGVIGLGAGAIAAWGRAGDYFRFYEINDEVERLARSRFSFLSDSPAKIDVIPGDGRLSLDREPNQEFDVLVLDAFSGDAPPVHLLTQEAFEIYLRHLKPDGVIAVNTSNRYVNMQPVLQRVAYHFRLLSTIIEDVVQTHKEDPETSGVSSSAWVLLSRNQEVLNSKSLVEVASKNDPISPKVKMWTDDEVNLFRIVMVDEKTLFGRFVRRLQN